MAGSARLRGGFVLLWLLCLSPARAAGGDQPETGEDWQAEIQRALDADFSVDAVDLPLEDVARFLQQKTGVLVLIDRRALDDIGLSPDVPVTCRLKDIRLRSVLRHALRPLDLTFELRDGALLITTPEWAELRLITRVYEVSDLVRADAVQTSGFQAGECPALDMELIDAVTTSLQPTTWEAVGGPGSIAIFRGRLTVAQTREVHAEIAEFLDLLRQAKRLIEQHGYQPPDTTYLDASEQDPEVQRIRTALKKKITVAFDNTPLEDVVAFLADQAKINVWVDDQALEDAGLGDDASVTLHASKLRLEFVLRHVLRERDLTCVVRNQVLLITTPEEAETQRFLRVYPVADLLGKPTGEDLFGVPFRPANADDLIDLITSTADPASWDVVGGPGSITTAPGIDALLVSQTEDIHQKIAAVLQRLRQAASRGASETAGSDVPPREEPRMRLVIYRVPSRQACPPATGGGADGSGNAASGGSDAPASTANQVGGFGSFPAADMPPLIPEDELLQLIVTLIEPRSWSEPGAFTRAVPGRLLIRQTDDVHRQIERLLGRLIGWQAPGLRGSFDWRYSNVHGFGGGLGGSAADGLGGGMF